MSHPLLITLKSSLKEGIQFYIEAFPRAYVAYLSEFDDFADEESATPVFEAYLHAYIATIEGNADAIMRIAAQEIGNYLNLYNIHANQSADEYKITYFLGRAIGRHVEKTGLTALTHIHFYTMIGLMGDQLTFAGCHKPELTRAMKKLIKANQLEAQLGATGGYLVYKCVSTAVKPKKD